MKCRITGCGQEAQDVPWLYKGEDIYVCPRHLTMFSDAFWEEYLAALNDFKKDG